ncbi:MAG: T9SS type A sorting domain-containing protein [Ignavibacteriota bacterium]
MGNVISGELNFPAKQPITGENYMKILIVYVMFDGENFDPYNSVWPVASTNGPSYKGTMISENKNSISDWWNAYNPETQSISSWFCENSRGQTHVIGKEYFVKLQKNHTVNYYITNFSTAMAREDAINKEIYDNLTSQGVIWADYDKWTFDLETGNFTWGFDYNIDMIYKVHRYKYYDKDHPQNALFSYDDKSGYSMLGYGSNTTNPYTYNITQNGHEYHFLGGFPGITNYEDGSGVTVLGNPSSGVLDKAGAFGRLMHENGHWFFGTGHSNVGMMGDVWNYSFDPWEKIKLGYVTPYISNYTNNPFEEVLLDDISARTTNGKYILKVSIPDTYGGEEFLLSSNYKISSWDRTMIGDTAYYDINTNYGKGIYIYHNGFPNYPNNGIDIECADGLWRWVQNGYDAPDWNPSSYSLPILNNTEVIRTFNDNGTVTDITDPLNQNAVKDGLDVRGKPSYVTTEIIPKYFSIGQKGENGTGCGTDRIYTNSVQNWTSREFQVDRWDAWKPEYNEIFSPYSSPSTYIWNSTNSGTFIWIKEHNDQTNKTKIWIFRDGAYNTGGMSETDILEATPPSRPMGIKLEEYYTDPDSSICHPKIIWQHNIEPDMPDINTGTLKYVLYKATYPDMTGVPGNYQAYAQLDFLPSQTPYFIDYPVNEYDCSNFDRPPYGNPYPIRYKVKAVDKSGKYSVYSDFVGTEGISNNGSKEPPSGDNIKIDKDINFNISQNYPNPFNPTTKINYALPKQAFVSLKIYDLTGREIQTLVNDVKKAGYYTVDFNGSNLSSGVYFYIIQSSDFVMAKRMILIK